MSECTRAQSCLSSVVSDSVTLWTVAHQALLPMATMQETQVRSQGGEDPLEKEMATHSSVLAWRISWTEEPGGVQSMGLQSRTRQGTHTRMHYVTEGPGCASWAHLPTLS